MRSGKPSASTAAWSLVVSPPRERPMAAASAPLLLQPHRHGLSRWCYRSGHIQNPACQPKRGKAPPTRPPEPNAGNAHAPPSICQIPQANRASGPHCPPSTKSHQQTAGCPPHSAQACQHVQVSALQCAAIARPSVSVCSRLQSSSSLESELFNKGNPRMQTEPSPGELPLIYVRALHLVTMFRERLVRVGGLEPPQDYVPTDFKSGASTIPPHPRRAHLTRSCGVSQ